MSPQKNNSHRIILLITGITVLLIGIILLFIPPALFPDPANGFQVLRCMQLGESFNMLSAPDQSDISQNYTEFLTWWSPGQYLVPYFFKLMINVKLGQATAITITLCQLSGLAGFYCFFKKIGFSPCIAALSLVFIVGQLAFFVPYVFYNGGEVLLFAFEGWFLYGCATISKPGFKLLVFVLLAGWMGFFFKSSFIWIYAAGLGCLWIRLSSGLKGILHWIKNGLWIGIPAVLSLATIYQSFLAKGQSPATVSKGFKLTAETFSFPLSSPLLSGFSLDDFFHGLIYHFGKPMFDHHWAIAILLLLTLLSLVLILGIIRYVQNEDYKRFIIVFYFGALLFFGLAYLRQLNISYEARHFRIIGLLIVPGMLSLIHPLKRGYQLLFALTCVGIAFYSFTYLVNGFKINNRLSAKGITGLSQVNIDQPALNAIIKLDNENRKAVFVFVSNDVGLEIAHNRIINLSPIPNNLQIDMDDYRYDGFSGPLYIVMPKSYRGAKEKLLLTCFPGYTGFNLKILSNKYVLYSADVKR